MKWRVCKKASIYLTVINGGHNKLDTSWEINKQEDVYLESESTAIGSCIYDIGKEERKGFTEF